MSTLLLTGVNGQLGWELQRALAPLGKVVALTRAQLDLSRPDAIRAAVREHRPDIIVNPAAYTAVDKAETEPELAQAINGVAPGVLAEEAQKSGALLVHYSTDYVFDGSKDGAYTESDVPKPQSVYGQTKLAGENAIRAVGGQHLVLRTSWVYGVHGGNFVKTVLRLVGERSELRIVADQFGAPTWARLLANSTARILQQCLEQDFDESRFGLYHLTAGGRTSWHRYAEEIVRLARQYDPSLRDKALAIHGIATHEYPVAAKRPANSVLATDKISAAFGLRLPQWQDDLAHCLREIYRDLSD
ncbi:dTDP-4-dehydrorhamnose reductase [Ferrigenium sp. UT5]|uniref:dTDP-4-dehydrorhamnose reductase n=1 Tax=Ferrigenium sp. UT5 TaxID=3242105 RepID=UPI00354CB24B